MKSTILLTAIFLAGFNSLVEAQTAKPEDTEAWTPVPAVVTPGKSNSEAPSDAVILFNGKT